MGRLADIELRQAHVARDRAQFILRNPSLTIGGAQHNPDPVENVLGFLCVMDYIGTGYHLLLHLTDKGTQVRATQHVAQAVWDEFHRRGIKCRGRSYQPFQDMWEFFVECSPQYAEYVLRVVIGQLEGGAGE